jgi:hypothetical protein
MDVCNVFVETDWIFRPMEHQESAGKAGMTTSVPFQTQRTMCVIS